MSLKVLGGSLSGRCYSCLAGYLVENLKEGQEHQDSNEIKAELCKKRKHC
jgi:hypothetical protein